MTNAEAIRWLQLDIDMMKFDPFTGEDAYLNDDAKKTIEALDMAIEALGNKQKFDDSLLKSDPDSVSKGDVIYREAAIDCEYQVKIINDIEYVMLSEVQMKMRKLPSAQPKTQLSAEDTTFDCISRQVALDALNIPDYENGEAYLQYVNDKRAIETLPPAQPEPNTALYADGFNDGYEQCKRDAQDTFAQPDIIRCKDCRWRKDQDDATMWLPCMSTRMPNDFYCGRAERRTDADMREDGEQDD